MQNIMQRYIKIDDWIFEVKSIRALRVDSYGKPYTGIANICVNSDNAFVDGIMTKEVDDFSHQDYLSFVAFCRQLGMKDILFSGYSPTSDNITELKTTTQTDNETTPQLYTKSA